MNITKYIIPLAVMSFALVTVNAQIASSDTSSKKQDIDDDSANAEAITLSPLIVSAETNTGYGALSSSSSSRLNMRYIDVPQSVSVVTSEFLNDANLYSSREFAKYVPNVYPRANAHTPENIYVRGLRTSFSYVDGFASTFAIDRDSALYDRIEYVKGPASAAMGRGEAAGLVNFITKRPLGTNRTKVSLIAGTDSFLRTEIDHNGTIGEDGALSYRVPVYFEDGDGTRGGALMHIKKYGIAPSLNWRISQKTNLLITATALHHQSPGIVGEAYWSDKDIYRYQKAAGQLNTSPWDPSKDKFVPNDVAFGYPGKGRELDQFELLAQLTHKFSEELSLRIGGRWEDASEDYYRFNSPASVKINPADPSDYLISVNYLRRWTEEDSLRGQADLLFEKEIGGSEHQFVVGLDAYDQSGFMKHGGRGGLQQSMYNPSYEIPSGFDPETYVTSFSRDRNGVGNGYGYYGQYSGSFLKDKVTIMAGWRQDTTTSSLTDNRNNSTTDSGTLTTDVPRYSVTYKPTNSISLYYLHSEQADPTQIRNRYLGETVVGGATGWAIDDPRRSEQISSALEASLDEIGVKALLWDDKVTAAVSLFNLSRAGAITHEVIYEPCTNGIDVFFYNRNYVAAGESIHGFEAELFGQPTPRLSIYAAYAALSGTQVGPDGTRSPIESLIDSGTIYGKYSLRDQSGDGFEFIGGAKYWFSGWTVWPRSPITYSSDQYSIDAGINYHFKDGKYKVGVKTNNITNQMVYISPNSQWGLRRTYLTFTATY